MKKTGLGKGLDALFADNLMSTEENLDESTEKIHKIKVIEIEPNREQPRRSFDEEALDELATSIKTYGVLQPIIVNKKDDYYEIVAGERRWRAAKKAGLSEMPCIIKDDITDRSNKEIALIENLQRVDLNPIDKANGLKELIDDYGMTQKELADSIGISRSNIANSVRILNLDPRVLELAQDGKLYEYDTFTDTEKDLEGKDRPEFMRLAPNSITKVRVYIWIEGQDIDNYDFASLGKKITINFGFTKERYNQSDFPDYDGPDVPTTNE